MDIFSDKMIISVFFIIGDDIVMAKTNAEMALIPQKLINKCGTTFLRHIQHDL